MPKNCREKEKSINSNIRYSKKDRVPLHRQFFQTVFRTCVIPKGFKIIATIESEQKRKDGSPRALYLLMNSRWCWESIKMQMKTEKVLPSSTRLQYRRHP